MSIFEIQQSKQNKEFVMKNGSWEFEVFADILKTADEDNEGVSIKEIKYADI